MRLYTILFSLLFLLNVFQTQAQGNRRKILSELAEISSGWFEGFSENCGGNEFSYHSFRSDVSRSLITRCTDGKMAIEWKTEKIPEDFAGKRAVFLWIAAMALTPREDTFDVFFNGKKRFVITSSMNKDPVFVNKEGGRLSFVTVETDMHGDAHGYMFMSVPAAWLERGKKQTVKMVGRAQNSNTWIIVYQATDALSYLQNAAKQNLSLTLVFEQKDDKLYGTFTAPAGVAGKRIVCTSGKRTKTVILSRDGESAGGTVILPLEARNKNFGLGDEVSILFASKTLGTPEHSIELLPEALLENKSVVTNHKIVITAVRSYHPKTVRNLLELSQSPLRKGKILLMNSSHQDIAWMDTPGKCVIERDTMLITPLLELLRKNNEYRFDLEDALMIKEYVERHPDKKKLIGELLTTGKISCGATFTQPYEEMYSGEALARQFYFGAKWLKDEFGYDATVYWSEDVPGRTLQMMQMMRKAGVPFLMISRFEKGLYKWYSPDGSSVTMFSPGHYGNAYSALHKDFGDAVYFISEDALSWEKYYPHEEKFPVIPLLSSKDMSPATDNTSLLKSWKSIDGFRTEKGKFEPVAIPGLVNATAPAFFMKLIKADPEFKTIRGERPDVWLYIHGPSHQKALKAGRAADILLTQAEKFATINALVNGTFVDYPATALRNAWEAKIYPDHGWGGKNGDITDAVFKEKFEYAKAEAGCILMNNLHDLAANIRTDKKKGRPLVVFNSMNIERSDPVSIEVVFEKPEVFNVILLDEKGERVPSQLTHIVPDAGGSIKKAVVHFIAEGVPPIGYKTYYLNTGQSRHAEKTKKFNPEVENRFYKIKFSRGGLSSIFDKELNKELTDSSKFVAGEVFTMRSEGNGAGEFADIQQPGMEGFDKTGNYETRWEIEENGDVFTVYKYRQKIRNAVVEQRVKVYHTIKRIDFETSLLNWEGVLYREYRMALPLNMTGGQVAYEVPFGVVEVGKDEIPGAAGERYTTDCREIHPRGIENWISASDNTFGVTMSSSVAVADWIDPTTTPLANRMLQPLLLASRRSCHWEGNEYLQTGDHHFLFSITSHKPGWQNGANRARGANETLKAVWADKRYTDASMPESFSFFSTGDPGVFISTIKKAEDSDHVIIRLINMESTDKTVTLQSFVPIKNVTLVNLIEEEIKPLPTTRNEVRIDLGHNAIETIKLK